MFRNFQDDDMFNTRKLRNVNNTHYSDYNCAGFALNTFSWYCPHDDDYGSLYEPSWYEMINGTLDDYEITEICVNHMLKDFSDLRRIENLCQLQKGEYAIAFRIGRESADFHYMKQINGKWYEKMGGSSILKCVSEEEVFSISWDRGWNFYDGPLVLLAKMEAQWLPYVIRLVQSNIFI